MCDCLKISILLGGGGLTWSRMGLHCMAWAKVASQDLCTDPYYNIIIHLSKQTQNYIEMNTKEQYINTAKD